MHLGFLGVIDLFYVSVAIVGKFGL